jgi:hypothetical protein
VVIPCPGSIVKFGRWTGVIKAVYRSDEDLDVILSIWWVKNVYKDQGPELQRWSMIGEHLSPATFKELCLEMESTDQQVKQGLDTLTGIVNEEYQ